MVNLQFKISRFPQTDRGMFDIRKKERVYASASEPRTHAFHCFHRDEWQNNNDQQCSSSVRKHEPYEHALFMACGNMLRKHKNVYVI